jgi:hypothetical protein
MIKNIAGVRHGHHYYLAVTDLPTPVYPVPPWGFEPYKGQMIRYIALGFSVPTGEGKEIIFKIVTPVSIC